MPCNNTEQHLQQVFFVTQMFLDFFVEMLQTLLNLKINTQGIKKEMASSAQHQAIFSVTS